MRNENSIPANKTAALSMSKGIHYLYEIKGDVDDNENYIPFTAPDYQKLSNPSFIDFTGFKKGRLLVLGLHSRVGRWVCRCSCGTYVVRKAKALKNKLNDDDCCVICRNTEYLKNKKNNIDDSK